MDGTSAPDAAEAARALHERRARFFDDLAREPWHHDFFAALRRIDALWPDEARLGTALRPSAEPVRLGQNPELDFAPAAIMSFDTTASGRPRMGVRFFGLFGPMGPMPLHLTEYTRDRLRNHGDATLARFADVFHHRMLLLFYRAWSQAQPTVQADRERDDQFAKWVSALIGQAPQALRGLDAVPDRARRFAAGHLGRGTRSPEAVTKVLRQYFQVPMALESHVGHWMPLRQADRTRLGSAGNRRGAALGVNVVAGSKVWDRQYKVRLHIGPLSLAQYRSFLPGQPSLIALRDWMRQLLGFEMLWDVHLVLKGSEVPPLQLGRGAALGRTAWLGRKGPPVDRGDLHLNPSRRSTNSPTQGQHHG